MAVKAVDKKQFSVQQINAIRKLHAGVGHL